MRRAFLFIATLFLVFALAACGQKSQEEVTSDLDKKLEKLQGYKAEATVRLHAGEKPKTFQVDVWYQKPDHYLISLTSKKDATSQMILKNDEGVFVLTPHLNKSYRFQSDWPQNGSQWYLYESLLSDILNDPNAQFETTEEHYIFTTHTNYAHKDLQKQKITLTKKELKPVSVQIMGEDGKVVVDMEFKKMVFNPEFDEGAFDLQRNMTSMRLEIPALADGKDEAFYVRYPLYIPKGSKLAEVEKFQNGNKVVLQYTGKKTFTLIEQKSKPLEGAAATVMQYGEPVNLGFAIGSLTDQSLSWTYDGVEYLLASKDLSREELIDVARSVFGRTMK